MAMSASEVRKIVFRLEERVSELEEEIKELRLLLSVHKHLGNDVVKKIFNGGEK